jgi:phosphonate transport system substrate-binding protein
MISILKTISYKFFKTKTWMSLLLLTSILYAGALRAEEYRLVIQPILPPDETRKAFTPLADYLSKETGATIKLVTAVNFLAYWETMKKNNTYDLIVDAAHFTDYRAERMGYSVLAKIPDVVSYTIVTSQDADVLEARDLIGKTIATIGSPSLGAVRLEEIFPNPIRQPIIIEVNNSREALEKVQDGKAVAAIVPTPLVGQYPNLVPVMTTEQVPHIALSASPRVPKPLQNKIRKALVNANKTDDGKAMLAKINFPSFQATSKKVYKNYASLLEGVWGY